MHRAPLRYRRFALAVCAALLKMMTASAADPPANLVLLHGNIHTEDPSRSIVQALALHGNTIIAVGTDQAVSAWVGPETRTVDLGGRLVLPGIIDAHTHPAESAQEFGKCSLDDQLLTPAQIKAQVARCLHEKPVEPQGHGLEMARQPALA